MMFNPQKDRVRDDTANLFKTGFVIIDLETTGLGRDPKVGIVEVGVIDHQGEVLFESLVKPKYPIPRQASAIHGITDKDVAAARTFPQIYPELTAILNEKTVVAFNVDFEQEILEKVCRRFKLAPIAPQKWHCAMRAYSDYCGQRKFIKLGIACKTEGVVIENAHRALGDCRMTLGLLQKMGATV
jgi:DNA polymerase-3 subunit epsilon